MTTALIAASLCPQTAQALDWKVTPSIAVSTTATDNSNQSANDPQGALILTVTPRVNLISEGSRRIKAALNYGVSGTVRAGGANQSNNKIYHNLAANGKAELVEDFLFIDGTANISQQLISLLGSPSDANTNGANRTSVGTYSLSPYMQKRFGSFANSLVRYTHAGAIFQNDVAPRIQSDQIIAALTSGPQFGDVNWSLNYSQRQANNRATSVGNASTLTFERMSATLGTMLTRKFRIFGTVGRDNNNFITASKTNGSFYSVGFGWAPSQRTSLEMSAGKRFLGNTFALSLRHRAHYFNWAARYSEDVSDISQQFLSLNSQTYFECPPGSDIFFPNIDAATEMPGCRGPLSAAEVAARALFLGAPLSDLIQFGVVDIGIANGVFIIKSLRSNVSWTRGKLGIGLFLNDTRRSFLLQNNVEDHVRSISGRVDYRLNPSTTANGALTFTNTQVPAGLSHLAINRNDDLYTVSLGLSHRFDPKLTGLLTLLHQTRKSNDPLGNYDENRITATVNKSF